LQPALTKTVAFSKVSRSKARSTGFEGLHGWLDRVAGGNRAIGVDDRKRFSILTALEIERLVGGAVDVDDLTWF
jgi:hypothetical protein